MGKINHDQAYLRARHLIHAEVRVDSPTMDLALAEAYVDLQREYREACGKIAELTKSTGRLKTDGPPEYKGQMSTHDTLAEQGRQRYEPGKGPWSKEADLDQVDLVHFEQLAASYEIFSDLRGLLSGCVARLVREVRQARGWPNADRGFKT
jgi:hypothetical protein